MFYTIYKITNLINGKYYIGKHQTKNLDDGYMGSGKLLKYAIAKHGIENFKKEILHVFDTEAEMNAKEKELVIVCKESYNLNEGGHGGFSFINRHKLNLYPGKRENDIKNLQKGEEGRKKYYASGRHKETMKIVNKLWISEQYPDGIWKGKKHSNKTKNNMSRIRKGTGQGILNSQYGSIWVTNEMENKKIKKEELDQYILNGYRKGRVIKKVSDSK
jgi:hypothetical protein